MLAVHTLADALRVDASRLAVCGDSAGGTLSLAASLQLRGTPHAPLAQARFTTTDAVDECPPRDLRRGLPPHEPGIRWFRDNYLPNEADREHILASPIRGHDLSGLPPSLLVVAGFDPIRDESTLLKRRSSRTATRWSASTTRASSTGSSSSAMWCLRLEAVKRTAAWWWSGWRAEPATRHTAPITVCASQRAIHTHTIAAARRGA